MMTMPLNSIFCLNKQEDLLHRDVTPKFEDKQMKIEEKISSDRLLCIVSFLEANVVAHLLIVWQRSDDFERHRPFLLCKFLL